MSSASSTRPPTPGQASSEPQGEAVSDMPQVDLPSWEPSIIVEEPVVQEAKAQPALAPKTQPALSEEELALLDEELVLEEQAAARAAMRLSTPPSQAPVEELPGARQVPSVWMPPSEMTALSSPDAVSGPRTPPPGTPLPVLLLVDQARDAPPEQQPELARRINRLLDQMAQEGGSRHVADWFHHLIESGRLEGLADAAGHSCHETAIRGLLSMGFPYALEVSPEDLQRIRPKPPVSLRDRVLTVAGTTVAVGGALAQLVVHLLGPFRFSHLLTLEVGVSMLALIAVLVGKRRTPLRQMGLAVLLVSSLLSIFLGTVPGYAGLVSGLTGGVAALLFALRES